jgi:hypothetical protein
MIARTTGRATATWARASFRKISASTTSVMTPARGLNQPRCTSGQRSTAHRGRLAVGNHHATSTLRSSSNRQSLNRPFGKHATVTVPYSQS